MDSKDDSSHVWPTSAEHEESATQVHFVPDAGTVAQIVYTDDQVRPPQQVVYTADGASYTSVDGPEHTLVYIHPVEAAQTLFTDPGQVAYVQQDATAQQVKSCLFAFCCLGNNTVNATIPWDAPSLLCTVSSLGFSFLCIKNVLHFL